MKKLFLFVAFASAFIFTMESMAAPAKPVKHLLRQPNGITLETFLRGDEFLHYYVTTDDVLLLKAEDGYWKYATLSAQGIVIPGKHIAKRAEERTDTEKIYIEELDKVSISNAMYTKVCDEKNIRQKVAPGEIKTLFPTVGKVRGLVILAQYQDIKFTEKSTSELFKELIDGQGYKGDLASGSVRDYFTDQSNGLFTPEFDVVGPVTLPQKRVYYGGDKEGEKASQMIIDACILADKEHNVDFSRYDCNDDGTVDFIYVIYAGYGQAQGGPEESVWPQSSTLEYVYWKTLDGMYLGRYSCSCELNGSKGEQLDGIGTFCHEFSHILGLPDIYDPVYSGCPGLGYWDIMDIGSYNNDSRTPAGYTAMDKYTVGWLTPEILEEPKENLRLEALGSSNRAYFIVSEKNPNEYYTLENRQNQGWDAHLPGHGLLITHIDYDLKLWNMNRVNTSMAGHERVKLIPADQKNEQGDPGDTYPGSSNNTSFTDNSKPAAKWHSGEKVGRPITNIREEDGIIQFDFMSGTGIHKQKSDRISVQAEGNHITGTNPEKQEVRIYTIDGRLLAALSQNFFTLTVDEGIYVVKTNDKVMKLKVGH